LAIGSHMETKRSYYRADLNHIVLRSRCHSDRLLSIKAPVTVIAFVGVKKANCRRLVIPMAYVFDVHCHSQMPS